MVDALADSHRAGIIHKDVKPANSLVSQTGVVKLPDFGIAAIKEATATSRLTSSLAYTPPEKFAAHQDPIAGELTDPRDERSDLYSLAATLYAMGTGAPPFHSDIQARLINDILAEPVPPTGHRRPRWGRPGRLHRSHYRRGGRDTAGRRPDRLRRS